MTTLRAFEIPEDDAALPAWLEGQLSSPHLGELVAELSALREAGLSTRRAVGDSRSTDSKPTLESVLGNRLSQIRRQGLAGVPALNLRRLFRHPKLLVELQTHVLTVGGTYWDAKLAESDELAEMVGAGWSWIQPRLDMALLGATGSDVIEQEEKEARPARPVRLVESATPLPVIKSTGRSFRWFMAGVASAAAVAVAGFVMRDEMRGPQQGQQVAVQGWGWNRPDAIGKEATRAEYLNGLANSAEEWRKKRPDTPQALAQRISEFRAGCSKLILAEHKPLPPADRKWLVDKCRVWSKKLDEHLADIEAGKQVPVVRAQVDETVDRLVKALRDRAAHPAQA